MTEHIEVIQTEYGPARFQKRPPCQHKQISHGMPDHNKCFCVECGIFIANLKEQG